MSRLGFLALAAALAVSPALADSQDLLNGLKAKHGGRLLADPLNLIPTPSPTPTGSIISQMVAANKTILAQLQGDMADLLSLFGTGDEAVTESLQYPDLQDGNGHDCAIQGRRFTGVVHDHPLALTGDFINDLQNLRTVSEAAQKVCNSAACQTVFGDLSAQVSKSVAAVNSKVGAAASAIPGVGSVGGIAGGVATAASSVNVFSLLCGDVATISLVPPTIADPPTPIPIASPAPAATPSPTPTPTPSH